MTDLRPPSDARGTDDQQGFGDRVRKNAVFEALAVPAWMADGDGQLIGANPEWCSMTGFSASEHLGSAWLESVPNRERSRVQSEHEEGIRTGRPFDLTHSVVGADGREWRVRSSARPLAVGTGNEPGWILSYDRSEDFRDIIDAVPAWLWLKDADDRLLRINGPAAETTGRSALELEGVFTADVYPEQAARYYQDDCEVRDTRRPKLDIVEPFRPEGGEEIFISTDKIPLIDADGQARRVLVLASDVTEKILRERTLITRACELERSNSALGEFAYATSHDLKRPLRAIEHLAAWIAEDEINCLSPESSKDLETLQENASRLRQLIDGLLEFAHMEGGDDAEVELDDLLGELPCLTALPHTFRLELPETKLTVAAQPTQLLQVLINLVSNAIAHHDQESGLIQVRCMQHGDRLLFEVQDDGPGIPESDRDRVFHLFETLGSDEESQHTGMGLAFVRKSVVSLGGKIEVHPASSRGALFRFDWPKESRAQREAEL